MTSRTMTPSLLSLAALALCGSLALAQPPQAPPAGDPSEPQAAAPVERQPPSDANTQPGATRDKRHGPESLRHHEGNSQAKLTQPKRGAGFNGGPADRFRGPHEGGIGAGFGGPEGFWWKNPQIAQNLALIPDQIKRMDDIFQKSRIELIDLKANLEKQSAYLEPILGSNPPDTAKALAQIDKIADARASLEKAHARMLLGIRGVLTPDQWTKLSAHKGPGGPEGAGAPGGGFGPGGHGSGFGPGHGPNIVQPEPMQ